MNRKYTAAVWIPNLSRSSGGAEIYLLNLARILKEDCDVFILTAQCNGAKLAVRNTLKLCGMPEFPESSVS
jgi:hypothetical protein